MGGIGAFIFGVVHSTRWNHKAFASFDQTRRMTRDLSKF